jgi:hypothetical protein
MRAGFAAKLADQEVISLTKPPEPLQAPAKRTTGRSRKK